MSNLPQDDTSTGAITQGGRRRNPGGAVWTVIVICVIAVLLVLFWATTHKRAPAESGTTAVSGVGSGASARTPATAAANAMGSVTGAEELKGAAAASQAGAPVAARPSTAEGRPSASRP